MTGDPLALPAASGAVPAREAAHPAPALFDVKAVAGLLTCSPRTIYRLADGGKMPRPLKLGALVRWRRSEVEEWVAKGCPRVP